MDHQCVRQPAAGMGSVAKLLPTAVGEREVRPGGVLSLIEGTEQRPGPHGLLSNQQARSRQVDTKSSQIPPPPVLEKSNPAVPGGVDSSAGWKMQ